MWNTKPHVAAMKYNMWLLKKEDVYSHILCFRYTSLIPSRSFKSLVEAVADHSLDRSLKT